MRLSKSSDSAQMADSVKAGAITAQMIQSSSITASQMAENTITTAQLNEQILKYLKPEITHTPQAPGLIFGDRLLLCICTNKNEIKQKKVKDVNGKTLHDGNYTVVVSNDFGSVTSSHIITGGRLTSHTVASISMEMIFCPPGAVRPQKPAAKGMRRNIRSP